MDFSVLEARSESSGRPASYKAIGISLAVASGVFIGVSFVLKKIGLLKANVKYNEEAGEGYGYLRNVWWWTGMTLMIVGEICNFVAYAFVDAILVTPLGALSVVITTILSAIFLKERLSFVGKVGCFTCILGSVVIAMNAPEQSSVNNIQDMKAYVITPGFLTYAGVIVVGAIITAVWAGPRYGKNSMFVYISICSTIGGLSVVATQGLGSAILAQINGQSQFKEWFLYVLLVFVVTTLLTEIIYLNVYFPWPAHYRFMTIADKITESVEHFQRRSRHPNLLRFLHKCHYYHVGRSFPGIQRNGHADCHRRHGIPSNLRGSSIAAAVEVGQGRSRRGSLQGRPGSSARGGYAGRTRVRAQG